MPIKATPLPDVEVLREMLDYDPETGILVWKRRDIKHFNSVASMNKWNGRHAGKVTGSVTTNKRGYKTMQVRLFDKLYYAHRLIWKIVTGEEPPLYLDHEDGNGTNNRWENLRGSDSRSNSMNSSRRSDNKSGITGVSKNKLTGKWEAYVTLDGKRKYLGLYDTKEEAGEISRKARVNRGFSDRHGDEAHYREDRISD